jgi:flagellar basal-body rod modification protein FlgD
MTVTASSAQSGPTDGSSLLASTIGANPAGSAGASQMFTTLLIAQIKNQDPTQPTDPSQYVTQLTQLSQLQSLETLTSQGSTATSMLQGLQALSLGAAVGSQVSAGTGSVVIGTTPVQGHFTLANANSAVSLVVTAASGVQQHISLGSKPAGAVQFSIDPASLGLPAGTYSVSVDTSSGETPSAQIVGTIRSVHVSAGGVTVDVSNLGEISSTDITSFDGPAG